MGIGLAALRSGIPSADAPDRPDLFSDGFDLERADAVLERGDGTGAVFAGPDLDGDGDADIVHFGGRTVLTEDPR